MSFLPKLDAAYLSGKGIEYSEVVSDSKRGLILRDFALPTGKYDAEKVDILIVIPPGFPDVGSDMFYMHPWIKLQQSGKYAKAADRPFQFNALTWQRWSRHSNEWRPGRDSIRTVIKRIQHALDIAE